MPRIMCNKVIKNILIDREGYSPAQACLVLSEIQNLSEELVPLLRIWIENPENMKDITIDGISLMKVKQRKNMTYLGALLTIDWLIKEPDVAKPIVCGFLV